MHLKLNCIYLVICCLLRLTLNGQNLILEKIMFEKPANHPEISCLKGNDSPDLTNISVDSVVLKNIFLDFNKADLLPLSYNELQKLFRFLADNPSKRIRIEGRTDNVGGYDFNLHRI